MKSTCLLASRKRLVEISFNARHVFKRTNYELIKVTVNEILLVLDQLMPDPDPQKVNQIFDYLAAISYGSLP